MITGLEFLSISIINEVETQEELFNNNPAKGLGSPIELKSNLDLKQYTFDSNKIYSLELNLEPQKTNTPSNPLIITQPQVNQQKPAEINGISSQLRLNNDFQPSLTINSSSFKSHVALPMGLAWNFELKGNYNNLTLQPDWTVEPSFSVKRFVNWLNEEIFNPPIESKNPSAPATGIRVIVPNEFKNSGTTPINLEQNNELDQTPQHLLNLDNSVRGLFNRRISSNFKFSWDANLNNVSVGVTSPLPGGLKDEVELSNNNNLSQFLINHEADHEFKGTVSLKYRLEINQDMKIELQNDYNLNNHQNATFIRWIEKH